MATLYRAAREALSSAACLDRGAGLAIGFAPLDRLALVVLLLAFRELREAELAAATPAEKAKVFEDLFKTICDLDDQVVLSYEKDSADGG